MHESVGSKRCSGALASYANVTLARATQKSHTTTACWRRPLTQPRCRAQESNRASKGNKGSKKPAVGKHSSPHVDSGWCAPHTGMPHATGPPYIRTSTSYACVSHSHNVDAAQDLAVDVEDCQLAAAVEHAPNSYAGDVAVAAGRRQLRPQLFAGHHVGFGSLRAAQRRKRR